MWDSLSHCYAHWTLWKGFKDKQKLHKSFSHRLPRVKPSTESTNMVTWCTTATTFVVTGVRILHRHLQGLDLLRKTTSFLALYLRYLYVLHITAYIHIYIYISFIINIHTYFYIFYIHIHIYIYIHQCGNIYIYACVHTHILLKSFWYVFSLLGPWRPFKASEFTVAARAAAMACCGLLKGSSTWMGLTLFLNSHESNMKSPWIPRKCHSTPLNHP